MARETLLAVGRSVEMAGGRWEAWSSLGGAAGEGGVDVLGRACFDGRAGLAVVVNGRFVAGHLRGCEYLGGIKTERLTRIREGGKRLLLHGGEVYSAVRVPPALVRCLLSETLVCALPRKLRLLHPVLG